MKLEWIESVFFNVLEDIKDYLSDLTLVGGWMPYVYSNFLWKNFIRNPVTTADIDFGVDQFITRDYPKTIFETLSSLDYRERLPQMDRAFPVVLYKRKIPVEFITYPGVDINVIEKLVGAQIQISKIDKFDFLLKHRVPIPVQTKKKNKLYHVHCPKPSAFFIIKERPLSIEKIKKNRRRICITCILFYDTRLILTQFWKKLFNTAKRGILRAFLITSKSFLKESQVRDASWSNKKTVPMNISMI
jgi:hypothetical protein